ncbi:tail protein X [Shewanella glacialipiscicola]|jgi:phage tail protein X|uniref:tail protein X n=1 Tax=Shewanella glacialipiscicola TaxID=614069 RepID=UPI003D7A3B98
MGSLQTVRSIEGDTVDKICYRYFGATGNHTEQVLDTNPHLAAIGPVLPNGTVVILPVQVTAPTQSNFIQLWD